MKSSDLNAFMRLLSSVSALYDKVLSQPLAEMYWAALQPFDLASIQQALNAHTRHPDWGKFMPKPAEIIRALQGDSQTQGLHAWSKVTQAIREVGSYASVVFDDPLIHAVIRDMGGWITLCEFKLDEMPFRGKDFVARYGGYVGSEPAYPAQLIGRLAHQHQLQGRVLEAPVCVGDAQKARVVYQQGQSATVPYMRLPWESEELHPAEVAS